MTKKDYVALAAALKDARARVASSASPQVRLGIELVEQHLVAALHADNSRFDADRFRQAAR